MNGAQRASPPHQRRIFLRTLINAAPLYYVREVQLSASVRALALKDISFLYRCKTILLFPYL